MTDPEAATDAPSVRRVLDAARETGWTATPGGLGYQLTRGRRRGWVQVSMSGGFVRGAFDKSDGSGLHFTRSRDMVDRLRSPGHRPR